MVGHGVCWSIAYCRKHVYIPRYLAELPTVLMRNPCWESLGYILNIEYQTTFATHFVCDLPDYLSVFYLRMLTLVQLFVIERQDEHGIEGFERILR